MQVSHANTINSLLTQNIDAKTSISIGNDGSVESSKSLRSKVWNSLSSMTPSGRQRIAQANQQTIRQLSRLVSHGLGSTNAHTVNNLTALLVRSNTSGGKRLLEGRDIKPFLDNLAQAKNLSTRLNAHADSVAQDPRTSHLSRPHGILNGMLTNSREIASLSHQSQALLAHTLLNSLIARPDGHPPRSSDVNDAIAKLRSPDFATAMQNVLSGVARDTSLSAQNQTEFVNNVRSIMTLLNQQLDAKAAALRG